MSPNEGSVLGLNGLIFGWREILPEFKMGTVLGTNQFADFGAGVMFLPSALGYYNQPLANIPQYTPIAFSIKLFTVL
jgi:FKBP-type peptidyl-prolyl cis-trans isomerase